LTLSYFLEYLQDWTNSFYSPAPLDKRDKGHQEFLQHTLKVGNQHMQHRVVEKTRRSSSESDLLSDESPSGDSGQRSDGKKSDAEKSVGRSPSAVGSQETSPGASGPQGSPSAPRSRPTTTASRAAATSQRVPRTRSRTAQSTAPPKPTQPRGQSSGTVVEVEDDDEKDDVPLIRRRVRKQQPAPVKKNEASASTAPSQTSVKSEDGAGVKRSAEAPSGGVPLLKKPRFRKAAAPV